MNYLKKTATAELIPFISASLSNSTSNWLWTFNAEVADLTALNKLKPVKSLYGDYVECSFKLGTEVFNLIIENADSNDTGYSFSVAGRSRSVLLAEPYSLPITKTWPNSTAQTIVQELCATVGITLVWSVLDWSVVNYIADKRYPIDIISELAADLGAVVQSLPDGSLAVVYFPACSPTGLDAQVPSFSIATDTNLFSRAKKFVNNTNYNRLLITSETSSLSSTAPSVAIDEVVDGNDRLIKVFVTPFVPVTDIHLHHASGANINYWYEGVYQDVITDQLIIQDGKAQLSKPFDSLISVTWNQDVVGQLSIDNRGSITTVQGFGLVTIAYNSSYHRYRFSNLTGVDFTAIAVDEIAAPVDITAMSLELVMGDGNRVAPPVTVKTLSSHLALKARGEAELWKQIYDVDEYSIDCLYENTPILPCKIAAVRVRNEGLLFNGFVKSVSISIDTTITQSVVIEKPL